MNLNRAISSSYGPFHQHEFFLSVLDLRWRDLAKAYTGPLPPTLDVALSFCCKVVAYASIQSELPAANENAGNLVEDKGSTFEGLIDFVESFEVSLNMSDE